MHTQKKGLHSKNLSRALEDGGTLTSVFVPWNTCGVFILATLGVGAFEYAPYAILNFIVPIISIIYGITGLTITKLSDIEKAELLKKTKSSIRSLKITVNSVRILREDALVDKAFPRRKYEHTHNQLVSLITFQLIVESLVSIQKDLLL